MIKNKELKKLLIYLFIKLNGNNDDISLELLENKLGANKETVDTFLREQKVKLTDYCVFFEQGFLKSYKQDCINPVLIYDKRMQKVLHKKLSNDMLVLDFLQEFNLKKTMSYVTFLTILKDNGLNLVDTL